MPPRRWRMHGLIFLPALLCLESCSLRDRAAQKESDATIVRVGKESYGKADLDRFFERRLSGFQGPGTPDEVKSTLLDSFVEEKLLLQQAEELRIEADPKAIDSMRDEISASDGGSSNELKRDKDFERSMVESLKVQEYLHDRLSRELPVTQEECEAYYKEHLDAFVLNDVVRVREILVTSEAEANKIQSSLKANRNRNFNELARLYSKAPTAAEGGDLGMFQRGELPEDLEKVIFPLAAGTASKIVRTQYGYHIFFVEEKILAHQQKFYEVEDQIKKNLLLERRRVALARELASLADRIPIQVDRERLDFKYVGTGLASRGGKLQ